VTAYCGVKEGISCRRGRPGRPVKNEILTVVKTEKPAQFRPDITLNQAILSIRTEKKPTIYFLYLENPNLPIHQKVFSFSNPGYLSKHFVKIHVKKTKIGEKVNCRICDVFLMHRMHLQNHAEKYHGTMSRACI
jgi:hypothetical protein